MDDDLLDFVTRTITLSKRTTCAFSGRDQSSEFDR
jgi:hypothetical protein